MAAASSFTYDADPPRRPSLEDLGGADYEDDAAFPPDRTTMPNALEHNERARNQAALNRVTPTALLHVIFTGGDPVAAAVRAMRSSISAEAFTLDDNGDGDTSITWDPSLLPAVAIPPSVDVVEDVEIDRARAFIIENGVRVVTKLGATGTDCAFVLTIR